MYFHHTLKVNLHLLVHNTNSFQELLYNVRRMAATSCLAAPAAAWCCGRLGALEKLKVSGLTEGDDLPTTSRVRVSSVPGKGRLSLGVLRMESATTETKKKIARLNVHKKQTVPLPTFTDAAGNPQHLRQFLQEPEGRQCMLNTKTLRKYEEVSDGVFLCYLPTMEFLNFEVAPVIELLVDAREDSCQVDMLSCKFEGSALIRGQNERFSASLRNHLSWSNSSLENAEEEEEQFLHVRVELDVCLEVYTLPFTVLPISAVESPGTLILQALVDRLIPLFVDQLFMDYKAWASARKSIGDGAESPGLKEEQMGLNGSLRN